MTADGKVIVGISGAEYGIRGFVTAYDAATGALVWRFYTIPSPARGRLVGPLERDRSVRHALHRDLAREQADSARYADAWRTRRRLGVAGAGGGSRAGAGDLRRRQSLARPRRRGAPGRQPLHRRRWSRVDLGTGKLRWYFQELPHDIWDLDAASPVVLVDLPGAGGDTVRAVAQAGKTGWVYVLDRATGRPIRRSDAFVPQANLFAQPTPEGVRMLPGANGGSEWSPPAYSPETGYLYVLGLHQPMLYKVKPAAAHAARVLAERGLLSATASRSTACSSAVDLAHRADRLAGPAGRPDDRRRAGDRRRPGLHRDQGQAVSRVRRPDGTQLWRYDAEAGVNAPPI